MTLRTMQRANADRLCLGAPRTRDELVRGLTAVGEVLRGPRETGAAIV